MEGPNPDNSKRPTLLRESEVISNQETDPYEVTREETLLDFDFVAKRVAESGLIVAVQRQKRVD